MIDVRIEAMLAPMRSHSSILPPTHPKPQGHSGAVCSLVEGMTSHSLTDPRPAMILRSDLPWRSVVVKGFEWRPITKSCGNTKPDRHACWRPRLDGHRHRRVVAHLDERFHDSVPSRMLLALFLDHTRQPWSTARTLSRLRAGLSHMKRSLHESSRRTPGSITPGVASYARFLP
jgi:hypothetical protein